MNETRSIDARCIFYFNLSEQLKIKLQKTHKVKECLLGLYIRVR